MRLTTFLLCFLPVIASVLANVEKTIFIAPEAIEIPQQHPNLNDLHLDVLTTENPTLRTLLPASFPKPPNTRGTISWFLLENLRQTQRHEVRICWPATQPTSFTLDTYTLSEVFASPELISSLASYSEDRESTSDPPRTAARDPRHASVLFLRVIAAADYFTTNKTLMREVSPVNADIILDPFIFNILPRSLLPTGIYLIEAKNTIKPPTGKTELLPDPDPDESTKKHLPLHDSGTTAQGPRNSRIVLAHEPQPSTKPPPSPTPQTSNRTMSILPQPPPPISLLPPELWFLIIANLDLPSLEKALCAFYTLFRSLSIIERTTPPTLLPALLRWLNDASGTQELVTKYPFEVLDAIFQLLEPREKVKVAMGLWKRKDGGQKGEGGEQVGSGEMLPSSSEAGSGG
ncbi:MAG: hypothetical protein HETSPECPRED_009266 [Heterodermia speciosa]|uniref:F-box domain-containing protein n=1 Tax=Heterodermia speciosa TaxID=116794 RepID=A0A8H3FYE2_9LECA|nr:MAG: hypothetical protein HETSPECPRED_009266 [Heterodermia speciosa]